MAKGTLYVVATPIGNLGDVTLRAIDTLRSAGRVLAEDTRRTRSLLSHLGISGKPVERLDAHASAEAIARVVAHLEGGEDAALCTDAGTPVVSDPGTELVRAAVAAGITVVPVPGPSAVMAAVSVSGLVDGGFRFLGFLPRSGRARREAIARAASTDEAVVLFEAPQRLGQTLADLAETMPERGAMIGRELTKLHEELIRGPLRELAAVAATREWLGEVTLVVGPRPEGEAQRVWSDEEIERRIDEELEKGRRAREVADALSLETGMARRDLYARVIARRR